jgi:rusticyanin
MRTSLIFTTILAAALLGAGLVAGVGWASGRAANQGIPTAGMDMGGMMGGMMQGMMGGGMMGGPVQATSPAAVRALAQRVAATATVDRRANTLTYRTRQVELVALASPEGGPDMTWNVAGLVNPTIVLPTGARVTVHVFDADPDTAHGWELTSTAPPYPPMAMMAAPVALPGAVAMPVRGATAQRWFGRTVRFTATDAGTFYYLCQVPGHAQQGMYGTLVVR